MLFIFRGALTIIQRGELTSGSCRARKSTKNHKSRKILSKLTETNASAVFCATSAVDEPLEHTTESASFAQARAGFRGWAYRRSQDGGSGESANIFTEIGVKKKTNRGGGVFFFFGTLGGFCEI